MVRVVRAVGVGDSYLPKFGKMDRTHKNPINRFEKSNIGVFQGW